MLSEDNGGTYSYPDAEAICKELNMIPAILSRELDLKAAETIASKVIKGEHMYV